MGNTVKKDNIMAIKRYNPKYKNLPRLQQPFWLEKRRKILNFSKIKWDRLEKSYFPRKIKFFLQDLSSYRLNDSFGHDRPLRLQKTFRFLLFAKQRLQKHFGEGRLRLYQLKKMARLADGIGKTSNISSSGVFHGLLEKRLEVILFRLGLTSSIMQARRLLTAGMIKINNQTLPSTFGYGIGANDIIKFDPLKFSEILDRYLKTNLPIFYFRKKKKRGLILIMFGIRLYLHLIIKKNWFLFLFFLIT